MVNFEFYARAVAAASQVFTVLGEGTFHQVHGGAATGLPMPELMESLTRWLDESKSLGADTAAPDQRKFVLAGHMPPECERWLRPDQRPRTDRREPKPRAHEAAAAHEHAGAPRN